ncbi:hypothetical protein QUA20_16125 [Microcoleus sp. Pol7_A1]|uniref:hypothetical protein n=1 Tax=Microcoleus sp. Pol7_A1 TaxID=2818893 RepID=UPI002FD6B7D2
MSRCNPEANSPSILKSKATSTVGRGKKANLNTNLNFSTGSDEYVTLYLGDSLQQYDNWEQPTVIVSDGAYGILGFEGDTSVVNLLFFELYLLALKQDNPADCDSEYL